MANDKQVLDAYSQVVQERNRLRACLKKAGLQAFLFSGTDEEVAQHLGNVARAALLHEKGLQRRIMELEKALGPGKGFTSMPYLHCAVCGRNWIAQHKNELVKECCPFCGLRKANEKLDAIEEDGTAEHNAAIQARMELAKAREAENLAKASVSAYKVSLEQEQAEVVELRRVLEASRQECSRLRVEKRELQDTLNGALADYHQANVKLQAAERSNLAHEKGIPQGPEKQPACGICVHLGKLKALEDTIYGMAVGPEEQARKIDCAQWAKTRLVHVEHFNDMVTRLEGLSQQIAEGYERGLAALRRAMVSCASHLKVAVCKSDWQMVMQAVSGLMKEGLHGGTASGNGEPAPVAADPGGAAGVHFGGGPYVEGPVQVQGAAQGAIQAEAGAFKSLDGC